MNDDKLSAGIHFLITDEHVWANRVARWWSAIGPKIPFVHRYATKCTPLIEICDTHLIVLLSAWVNFFRIRKCACEKAPFGALSLARKIKQRQQEQQEHEQDVT